MGFSSLGDGLRLSVCEPTDWFVVFWPETTKWWVRWLAAGRFKHVSAFGYVERAGAWVFFDYELDRTKIYVVGNHEADIAIGHFTAGRTVVRMPKVLGGGRNVNMMAGAWCVPAVAHILGLPGCALRPGALFRKCLANGGVIICEADDEAQGSGRPGTAAPEGSRSAGEGEPDPVRALVRD